MAVPILKEPPITTREALIPYAMSGVNMLAPVLVAHDILSQVPLVFEIAVAMIILGLPVSIYFRQRQYNRIVLNLLTMLPLLILTWALTHMHPGLQIDWNNPWTSMMAKDNYDVMNGLLLVFALLSSGRAFLLVTSTDMLQTPLPSFSIFLLAAITSNNHPTEQIRQLDHMPLTFFCLLLLCMSTLYLFSQEQSQRWFAIHTPLRFQRRLILWTFIFALLILPAIVGTGWSLQPLNMTSLAKNAQYRHPFGFHLPFFSMQQMAISFGDNLDMMSTSWPHGKQTMMTVKVRGKAQYLLWRAGAYAFYNVWTKQWQPDQSAPTFSASHHRAELASAGIPWTTGPNSEGSLTGTLDPVGSYSDPGLAEAVKEGIINPIRGENQVVQEISLRANVIGAREAIYGLYQIYQVTAGDETNTSSSNSIVNELTAADDGSVSLSPPYNLFTKYKVVSLVKPLPTLMPHLKKEPVLPDRDKYLQMPPAEGLMGNSYIPGQLESDYAKRIQNKTLEILAEDKLTPDSSPFEVVHQLELYLGKHYRYTLTPDPPKGATDPILNFLFNQQQGYCTYFSSAMVMMCRSIGLPARLVTGFASGELVDNASSGLETTYQVTSDDAHSWVEVYLPDYGWYTMDPTAGSKPVSTFWGETWDNITNFFADTKALVTTVVALFRTNSQVRGNLLLAFAVTLVLLAGVFYLRREHPPTYPRRTLSDEQARHAVLAAYRRMHRWLHLWGVMKPEGITASEFERLFRSLNPPMGDIVGQLTRLYLRTRYGAATIHDDDARQAITLLHQLWKLAGSERKHLHAQEVE